MQTTLPATDRTRPLVLIFGLAVGIVAGLLLLGLSPLNLFNQTNAETTIADVDALGVHAELPMKGKTTLTMTPSKPGRYELYCGVRGHKDAGMVGTLIVE